MGKTKRCLLDLLLAALCVGLGLLLPGSVKHEGRHRAGQRAQAAV